MKNFGGNMKRFSLLFILVFAVAAFGQEAMEAPVEEMATEMVADSAAVDTMAMDEMLMTDTTAVMEEAVVEEDAGGDALEAMLAEEGTMEAEVTSGSALIGYTLGLDVGYPLYLHGGLGSSFDTPGPAFGLVVNSPFGAAIGPFEIGFGAQVGMFSFTNEANDNELSGIYALATANTALLETEQGAVSAQVGAGYFGASLGFTAGAAFDYAVSGMPLVIRPYARMNATLDSGVETSGDDSGSYAWLNAGIMLSYDISTLF
jgi:hypothetical protein